MSTADVQKILDGLNDLRLEVTARFVALETQSKIDGDMRGRVRRLELAGIAIAVLVLGYAFGIDIPVIGQGRQT